MPYTFPRGVKRDLEEIGESCRKRMGVELYRPLEAKTLCEFLRLPILSFKSLESALTEDQLIAFQAKKVSGLLTVLHDKTFILYSEDVSPVRLESDLMHEVAHYILQHSHSAFDFSSTKGQRIYHEREEAEATWLGAALQIPKPGMYYCSKFINSIQGLASHFGSSIEMARFRVNTNGLKAKFQ